MIEETPIEMVRRHIREGEVSLARQRHVIATLQASGHDIERAERLLAEFEDTQVEHIKHLQRLLSQ